MRREDIRDMETAGACPAPMGTEEIERIVGRTLVKIAGEAKKRRFRPKVAVIAAVAAVAMVSTALAVGVNTGLFGRALGDGAERYAGNINEVADAQSSAMLAGRTVSLKSTIFTDNDVYVILGVAGLPEDAPAPSVGGRIAFADADQTLYGLTGRVGAVAPEDGDAGVRYFLYSGTIAETSMSGNRELVIAAGNNFLKYNSLRDCEGARLELTVALDGGEAVLAAPVENVSTEALSFHPDLSQIAGDFYDTVLLTPYELKLSGQSARGAADLRAASQLAWDDPGWYWFMPDVTVVIRLTDGTGITVGSDAGMQIASEKAGRHGAYTLDAAHPCGGSAGGDEETGEFYSWFNFHGWELDLSQVESVSINGTVYPVAR